jgi:hypothetical protein
MPLSDHSLCEARNTRVGSARRVCSHASFYANTLIKGVLHRFDGAVLHCGEHVRVGVERDGYGGVPQHLRDNLGVDVLGEQQRGAGAPEVVEAYLRQPRLLEQRLESVRGDVALVHGLPGLGSKYEAVLLPQIARPVKTSQLGL